MPATVPLEVVRVSVAAPLELRAPNVPPTPLGSPDTLSLTVPVNPFCGVTWMVAVALDPACAATVPGVTESANNGALGVETRSLIKGCPAGVPHPVARSKPAAAARPLLPVVMSCRSLARWDPLPMP